MLITLSGIKCEENKLVGVKGVRVELGYDGLGNSKAIICIFLAILNNLLNK